jgi:hypothetical protein
MPLTPAESPRKKEGYWSEMQKQDLEAIALMEKDLKAIKSMSDEIDSADVDQAPEALNEARRKFVEISKSITRLEKELARLRNQRLVVASSIDSLDYLLAKNLQQALPNDDEWDAIGKSAEGPGSASRGADPHRRVQTDKT